jgi:hypothetical protein
VNGSSAISIPLSSNTIATSSIATTAAWATELAKLTAITAMSDAVRIQRKCMKENEMIALTARKVVHIVGTSS